MSLVKNLADGVQRAYSTKWSYVNTFDVIFSWGAQIQKKNIWTPEITNNLSFNVKDITTPQYTNQPIEAYVGDQWRIHNGRNELWRFTITFRDQDQLSLYRRFVETYNTQKDFYFDDVVTSVLIFKDADHSNERDNLLFDFPDALIESVSSISFSNETESQIAEFSVNFKCPSPTIHPN